ncbi:hypothetical protein [Flindersiella endophytica]
MSETNPEAQRRTEAFARVIGPYVAIFTGVIAIRLSQTTSIIDDLFASQYNLWMLGALMIGGGLVIIGGHRHWRGPAAVVISLFGWFVGLRGFALIAIPSQMETAVDATTLSPGLTTVARIFFVLLGLVGLWLSYVGWIASRKRKG